MNIGFFDSGLGGLIILKAVAKKLPQYDYIYYGDTAHLPYGDKTEEEIYTLTKQGIEELFKRNCVLVVVACNTASAETIRKIQDTFLREEHPDKKILGVIVPTAEVVIENGQTSALLIATKRTVESGKYEREFKKLNDSFTLTSVAAPILVPLIETHEYETASQVVLDIVDRHESRKNCPILLGCTHYALLKDALRDHFGSQRLIISQDEVIPLKLENYLHRHPEITERLSNTGKREIILTEHRPDYDRLTAEFLGGAYIPQDD
jgi:glutamate racemase